MKYMWMFLALACAGGSVTELDIPRRDPTGHYAADAGHAFASSSDAGADDEPSPVLYTFWPADAYTKGLLERVAERIYDATEVRISVSTRVRAAGNVAVFWADPEMVSPWVGYMRGRWIALSNGVPDIGHEQLVMHEVLHKLGIKDHVTQGTGLMSENMVGASPLLTTADLAKLCSVVECGRQIAEAE